MIQTSRNRALWIAALAAVFVFIQLALVWSGGVYRVFNSPDANANYHFAYRLYASQALGVQVRIDPADVASFIGTRSTRVADSAVYPVSFVGLIVLYAAASKLLFLNLIPYWTALVAGISVFLFYRAAQTVFSERAARISALLLALHPAWWYYTNNSLFPNALFTGFVIAALYCATRSSSASAHRWMAGAGACIALALFVRLSEAFWLAPVLALAYAMARPYPALRQTVWFFVGLISAAVLAALLVLAFGFQSAAGYQTGPAPDSAGAAALSYLAPFGFHPRLIILHARQYALGIFWPFTVLALVGLVSWFSGRTRDQRQRAYVACTLLLSLLLVVYYGSWQVSDTPDPSRVSIAVSHVRYLLPLYVFSMPLAALGLLWLADRVRLGSVAVWAGIAGLALFSYAVAYADPLDGIAAQRATLRSYETTVKRIIAQTPENAVILTPKGDKYVWPHRMVMTRHEDEQAQAMIRSLLDRGAHPVYLLTVTLTDQKRDRLNTIWSNAGLALGREVFASHDVSLYTVALHTGSLNP